jgi:hypothetical protein
MIFLIFPKFFRMRLVAAKGFPVISSPMDNGILKRRQWDEAATALHPIVVETI